MKKKEQPKQKQEKVQVYESFDDYAAGHKTKVKVPKKNKKKDE